MANVELRVCIDSIPKWGFVSDDRFYPFGPTDDDKKRAVEAFKYFVGNGSDQNWKSIPLAECGPNLDLAN
jgi:hypothetical protein